MIIKNSRSNSEFELDTANLLTEDLHKNRASSRQVILNTSTTFENIRLQLIFKLSKGLESKFDHLYQFNQYPMQEFFGQFDLLKRK